MANEHQELPLPSRLLLHLYGVHEGLIFEFACHHAPVLDKAFNSSSIEGQGQTYQLKEIDNSATRLLVQWFYREEFDVYGTNDLPDRDQIGDPDIHALWARQDLDLIQLWVIANQLRIPKLQNTIVTKLQEIWLSNGDRGASTAWIPYAYKRTAKGSPLRALAVDQCLWVLDPTMFMETPEDFPHEILLELAFTMSISVTAVDEALPNLLEELEPSDLDEAEDPLYDSEEMEMEMDKSDGSTEDVDWQGEEADLSSDCFEDEIETLTTKYDLTHISPIECYRCNRRHRPYLVSEKQ